MSRPLGRIIQKRGPAPLPLSPPIEPCTGHDPTSLKLWREADCSVVKSEGIGQSFTFVGESPQPLLVLAACRARQVLVSCPGAP